MNGHDGHLPENEFQVFVVKLNEKYLFEGIHSSTHSTVVVVVLDNESSKYERTLKNNEMSEVHTTAMSAPSVEMDGEVCMSSVMW